MNPKPAIAIGNLVIETASLIEAIHIAKGIKFNDAVRGTTRYHGKPIRWSTLQQYEYHQGFTKS